MHKVATSRASKAIKIPSETLCPFLYQTRTIANYHRPPSTPETNSNRNESNTLTFLQRKARDVEVRRSRESTLTASERKAFIDIMRNFGARIDGIALPPDPIPEDSSHSPTTQSTVDEPLFGVRISTETPSIRATNTNINDILSLFAPVETKQQFSTFSRDTTGSDPTLNAAELTPQDTRKAAMTSLQYVSQLLKSALSSSSAPPDLAVWRVLCSDILPLIKLLQTSNTPSNINPYQRTLASIPSEDLPPSISYLQPETPLLPLLTILYPAATLLALRTYIAHLPASGYALAVLPTIRSHGPASYLLAGNTHFFNALLYLHWTVYSDLRAIYQILGEMKRSGVEYDQSTFDQIQEMQRQRNEDMQTSEVVTGGRSRTWWTMKMQEDGWRGVMRKYKFDMLGAKHEGRKKAEGMEDGEMDREIM